MARLSSDDHTLLETASRGNCTSLTGGCVWATRGKTVKQGHAACSADQRARSGQRFSCAKNFGRITVVFGPAASEHGIHARHSDRHLAADWPELLRLPHRVPGNAGTYLPGPTGG